MTADAWITLIVIAVLVVIFVTERIGTTLAIGGAVAVLYVVGVLELPRAFAGFTNAAPITVGALYVVAGAADITGALSALVSRVLGSDSATSVRRSLVRVVAPVTALSAFIPNTPLVAMLAPRVQTWARNRGDSPSRYLMPLSFATILGGVITVLGTSTNLVVNGLLTDSGNEAFSIFAITRVGLPVAIIGGALLVFVAPLFLPERRAPVADLDAPREFTLEMRIPDGSPLDGRTVEDAGLRALDGVYLIEVERDGAVIVPVAPAETLRAGDRLVFAGNIERIVDLQNHPGLVMAEEHHFGADRVGQRFFEAVVSETSPLNGATLKDVGFRNLYSAAVVAVHRAGERLPGKLGDTRLKTGDVLLVVGGPGFRDRMRDLSDFSVVATFEEAAPIRRTGSRIVGVAVVGLIVVTGAGLVDLTRAAVAVALGLVVLRVVTPAEARRSVNLSIILMIAFAFGLGNAVADSGLANLAASRLLDAMGGLGDVGVLAGILIATVIATELLSNNAAAALMFPIAVSVSVETGIALEPLAMGIMMMASSSYLTPIGYQTNTMVYGMGGYRFTDFARVGLPLTVVAVVATLLITPLAFPLR